MIVLSRPEGHLVIAQAAHAWMCGQLARAWGNERVGAVTPAEEVCLAAEQHEVGMGAWDLEPALDPDTGLPRTVNRMELDVHLPLRLEGPRRLMAQSRYAALLASLHHTSFYESPPVVGLARRPGRQIHSYLKRSADFRAQLRPTLDASDAEIDRNWRLVRAWDGLSHDLMYERAPCARGKVPAADGVLIELQISRRDDVHTIDPWPFAAESVEVRTEGRLLEETFTDERRLGEALAQAPWLELRYALVPA